MFRVLSIVGLVLLLVSCALGARDPEFNVDFFCGWDGFYRPMEWTPVEIGITSDLTEPFEGTFVMSARQDGLNTLNVVQGFVLMPDLPLPLPLVTKFAFGTERCDLSIRDKRGRTRWRQSINMWDYSVQNRLLRVVQEQDLLIGLIGQGQFGLLRLPRDTACMSDRGQGSVHLGAKVPRGAPWDWTGFASLDALVLYDPDWSLLKPSQVKAIGEWIANGGRVLLVLGQHPLPQDNPLNDLLPCRIDEPRQVEVPVDALREWGLDASRPQTVTAWNLSPKPKALLTKEVKPGDGALLYAAGGAGFGRMAVLAFNPNQFGEDQVEHAAEFWARHITGCIHDWPATPGQAIPFSQGGQGRTIVLNKTLPESPTGFNPNDSLYRISIAQNASNQVMEHLYQLRQMRPLSIWWVILTLTALAVLLGPVDYLVLKRLDRLPYTWLTSTGWIVVFTFGAYYGVQWLRGGVMELRAVTVLDGIADSNCTWATCYAGLFAPRSDDYRLEGLQPDQWWSGIAPSREELYMHQREAGMRQIFCVQADGGNLPVSVPVNIWTVQSLLSEWAGAAMPFTAAVECQDDQVTVEIRNASDSPIREGFILFADGCGNLGRVAAHGTERFELRMRPFRSWENQGAYPAPPRGRGRSGTWPGVDIPRYPGSLSGIADNAFFAQGCLSRTLAMHRYLDLGAALVCVVFENAPAPFSVKDRTYATNHIQLARQLVFIDHR